MCPVQSINFILHEQDRYGKKGLIIDSCALVRTGEFVKGGDTASLIEACNQLVALYFASDQPQVQSEV
jgi:hypothetical protein